MKQRVREQIPATTGLLTVVSLVLVFGAVLGFLPELPANESLLSAIPHLNAVISVAAIATILYGITVIRNGAVRTHQRAMLASTALFAGFLVLYLYRVSIEGPTAFTGPDWIRQFVYLPVLAVHILLAIVCLPFVYAALLYAFTHDVSELPDTPHPRVGKIAAVLWLVSFGLGIVVYLLLYQLF